MKHKYDNEQNINKIKNYNILMKDKNINILVDTWNIALILFLKCDVTKLSHNVILRRPSSPPLTWDVIYGCPPQVFGSYAWIYRNIHPYYIISRIQPYLRGTMEQYLRGMSADWRKSHFTNLHLSWNDGRIL